MERLEIRGPQLLMMPFSSLTILRVTIDRYVTPEQIKNKKKAFRLLEIVQVPKLDGKKFCHGIFIWNCK
jgi:hypothetical protein